TGLPERGSIFTPAQFGPPYNRCGVNWAAVRMYCWNPPRTSKRVLPNRSFAKTVDRGSVVVLPPRRYTPAPSVPAANAPRWTRDRNASLRASGVRLLYQNGLKQLTRDAIRRGLKKNAFAAGAQCSTRPRLPRPVALFVSFAIPSSSVGSLMS